MSWVKDELAEVAGESSLVGLEALLTSVLASVINSDSDGSGELSAQSCSLDFGEGEALSESRSMVVSDGLASDSRSQPVERSRGDAGSSGPASLQSSALSSGLVEPDADVALPMLAEMDVGEDVVVLNHGL